MQQYKILQFGIFAAILLSAGIFFGVSQAEAAEIKITVTREGDGGPLESATVEVMCENGAFTQLTGDPATNSSGEVQAEPAVGSDCNPVSSENLYIRVSKVGHVTYASGVAQTYDPMLVLNDYTVSEIQFNLKVVAADELGNPMTFNGGIGDEITLNGNIPALQDPIDSNIYYFDGSGSDNALQLEKNGYVSSQTTNNNFLSISFIEHIQIRINLGTYPTCNSSEQITLPVECKGMEFAYVYNGIQSETGTPLNGVTLTAGSNNTSCTESNEMWYCPMPLLLLSTTSFTIVKDGFVSFSGGGGAGVDDRASSADPQVIRGAIGSMQYSHKFITKDELGNALTVDNATAGASSVYCEIIANAAYCPIALDDDNSAVNGLVAGKSMYVTTVAADVPLAGNRTAHANAQQVKTMDISNGLDFGVKATVKNSVTNTALSGATIILGPNLAGTCSEPGSAGTYYCLVGIPTGSQPIRSTVNNYYVLNSNYLGRTTDTDLQITINLLMMPLPNSSGGGGGGGTTGGATGFAPIVPTNPPVEENLKIDVVSVIDREADLISDESNPERYFIDTGTESTLKLGAGERAAAISSFKEAYGKNPVSKADWIDVLNIANGRWPITVNKTVEARAYLNFKVVYGRNADMTNSTDVNALKMMGYGVRSKMPRNLSSEGKAINTFISIFGFKPTTAFQWNIVRAITYSGLTR